MVRLQSCELHTLNPMLHFPDRVYELERELERYRGEVSAAASARRGAEAEAAAVARERAEFRSWRAAEVAKLDAWKADILSRAERERRAAVRQANERNWVSSKDPTTDFEQTVAEVYALCSVSI